MLSKELELSLNNAFKEARDKHHEFMTVEHLLLALTDNEAAVEVLKACGADMTALKKDLSHFLDETIPLLPPNDERDTQPTLGFQRVLQRAVFHVQSSGKREVTGANVLVAIFSEQESQAVYFLKKQDISRLEIVNFISHGISKLSDDEEVESASVSDEEMPEKNSNPLSLYASNLNELAQLGKIDPLIGRKHEIERTIQVCAAAAKIIPYWLVKLALARPL
jgi:ATP-dependent Clp protease ATP-binding subunit ClpA